jgi:hypothetical protein
MGDWKHERPEVEELVRILAKKYEPPDVSIVAPTVPSCLLACLEIYRGTAPPSVLLPIGYTGFAIHIYIIPAPDRGQSWLRDTRETRP